LSIQIKQEMFDLKWLLTAMRN